jgi:arsenate reductase
MDVTIYHNTACGTSRAVLAILQERGVKLRVIEYLKTPPTRDEVKAIAAKAGAPLRALLRESAPPYAELGLADGKLGDEQLLDAIGAHPILLNRPIVVIGKRARLCRPSETVHAFLDQAAD